jgi:hypothetical protein
MAVSNGLNVVLESFATLGIMLKWRGYSGVKSWQQPFGDAQMVQAEQLYSTHRQQ